jgi:hypothetical protein
MAGSKNKAVRQTGVRQSVRNVMAEHSGFGGGRTGKGIGGSKIVEGVPRYISSDSEKVIACPSNSSIVLGRDRPASRLSGYGGSGDTHCASIDLVAGRMASNAASTDANDSAMSVDPNFKIDAARIYISQKTDVDQNFGLASGMVGDATAKSAIGLKADGIRIVAREGIKLITKTDLRNSQGGEVGTITGVDIIAGNDDSDLQPMVLGNNAEEALNKIVSHIDKLNGIVDGFVMYQMKFNIAMSTHFHISPFFGVPTSPSPTAMPAGAVAAVELLASTKRSLMTHRANLIMFKNTYLSVAGGKYINSRYNNVN